MYTDSVTDAVLKGMGEQFYAMKVNIADACISVVLVYFLVPIYGVYGYIATIYIAEIINASLSVFKMIKVTALRPPMLKFLVCPLLCVLGSASACNILRNTLIDTSNSLGLVVNILFFIALYTVFMILLSGFSREDADWIKSVFIKEKN